MKQKKPTLNTFVIKVTTYYYLHPGDYALAAFAYMPLILSVNTMLYRHIGSNKF